MLQATVLQIYSTVISYDVYKSNIFLLIKQLIWTIMNIFSKWEKLGINCNFHT